MSPAEVRVYLAVWTEGTVKPCVYTMLEMTCSAWPGEGQLYTDVYSFFWCVRIEGTREISNCKSYPCAKQAALMNSLTMGMKESKKVASLSVHGGKMQYPRRQTGLQRSTGWCRMLARTLCQADSTQGAQ